MSFDNIKLEKGLYTSPKGFTQSLEEIDPSENYIGTSLEGLDAYQRQLKRFDIKVSGADSDSVSKFFQTSDSATLFPEYVSRVVRQGLDESDLLNKIIATTTTIDAMDYRSIESVPSGDDKTLTNVAEGAYIPETVIKTKETLTPLIKRGRMLVASYEAIKFQKLDLFTVTLKQIGSYIARCQLADALSVVADDSVIKVVEKQGDNFAYADLVNLWLDMVPYKLTTIIANSEGVSAILNTDEFKDSAAGCNFHATGNLVTPLGAEIVKTDDIKYGYIALDKTCAIEKVQAGGITTDFDKLIDRQLERACITTVAGFTRIFDDAARILL